MEPNSVCNLILLITSMIRERIGRHEVLLPVNQNYEKIRERNFIDHTFSLRKTTDNSNRVGDNQSRSRILLQF